MFEKYCNEIKQLKEFNKGDILIEMKMSTIPLVLDYG